jgi:hypothetical protein
MRVVAYGGRAPVRERRRPRYEVLSHGPRSERPTRERWANWVLVDHGKLLTVGYFRFKKDAVKELNRRVGQ